MATDSKPPANGTTTARIGAAGVYATPAVLDAHRRSKSERFTRAAFTLTGCWLVAPLAFMIPPYLESGLIAMLAGLYFARRSWVGEWVAVRLHGTCPRCDAEITLREGTVLYLPHTLHCGACRAECWLELEPAIVVDDAVRRAAIEQARVLRGERPSSELGGRPPKTWSPASSDWRDRDG